MSSRDSHPLISVGAAIEPSIIAAGRPLGLIFHRIGLGGYFEIWLFQLCRHQADIVPQAAIVGLARELAVVQAYEIVALVFLHALGEGDIETVVIGRGKVNGEQILAEMELAILAIVLDLESAQIGFFDHGHVIAQAVPDLEMIQIMIATIFGQLPHIGRYGQFVVQCTIVSEHALDAEGLALDGLGRDPVAGFQFAVALFVIVQELSAHKTLHGRDIGHQEGHG